MFLFIEEKLAVLREPLTLGVSKRCELGKLPAQGCHGFSRQQLWNSSLLLEIYSGGAKG